MLRRRSTRALSSSVSVPAFEFSISLAWKREMRSRERESDRKRKSEMPHVRERELKRQDLDLLESLSLLLAEQLDVLLQTLLFRSRRFERDFESLILLRQSVDLALSFIQISGGMNSSCSELQKASEMDTRRHTSSALSCCCCCFLSASRSLSAD